MPLKGFGVDINDTNGWRKNSWIIFQSELLKCFSCEPSQSYDVQVFNIFCFWMKANLLTEFNWSLFIRQHCKHFLLAICITFIQLVSFDSNLKWLHFTAYDCYELSRFPVLCNRTWILRVHFRVEGLRWAWTVDQTSCIALWCMKHSTAEFILVSVIEVCKNQIRWSNLACWMHCLVFRRMLSL